MTREILLDSLYGENRLAVIDDGELCEMYIEREGLESLSGNIYSGHVMNVLPGMNAAFVDIGLDKNAFLYAGDIQIDSRSDKELFEKLGGMNIRDLVKPGQQILVQVVKEPGGSKGPRVSSHITLAGRLLALLPTMRYVGVSRKISDQSTRASLREIAEKLCSEMGCGMIVRTAAEGVSENEIRDEYIKLISQWNSLKQRGNALKPPALVVEGGSLVSRAIRDMLMSAKSVSTDDKALYGELIDCAAIVAPEHRDKVMLYKGTMPLFDARQIDAEFSKLMGHRVWLKSGGYIVIDYTEALTVIDVNTGKFIGKKSLNDTIMKINAEAAIEIARQLRLRDLGGIIIVDFIDMDKQEERDKLLSILRDELSKDRTRTTFSGITSLGLVELTRKKSRQTLHKLLANTCDECHGSGVTYSAETIARKCLRDMRRCVALNPDTAYVVLASDDIKSELESIASKHGAQIVVKRDSKLHHNYKIDTLTINSRNANE